MLRLKQQYFFAIYEQNAELRGVIDLIGSRALSPSDPSLFRPLIDGLL
jgi:hypothetical protein